jgi:hypothetical protein
VFASSLDRVVVQKLKCGRVQVREEFRQCDGHGTTLKTSRLPHEAEEKGVEYYVGFGTGGDHEAAMWSI